MSPPVELNQDAFISYRHDNNQFVDENGKGWVDHFHERRTATHRVDRPQGRDLAR